MIERSGAAAGVSGRFVWAAATDIGKLREDNQDAFVAEPETGLFLVVDGMGGHRGGAVAARTVAQDLPPAVELGLDRLRTRSDRSIRRLLRRAILEQSHHVRREGDSESGYVGMGATLVLVLFSGDRAYTANVGDSRIYRLRDGRLEQLSEDHSLLSELICAGQITRDEAVNHSAQGVVTQYMGMPEAVAPHVRSAALKRGDHFLLCTDGLTDLASDEAITEILMAYPEPQAACAALIEAANRAGGTDNVTVIVGVWTGERQA
jgi:serine/threonine protein phosphatase PrpC